MGSSSKQTIGYKYGMGLHFGWCHGPIDAVLEIRVGDRTAWTGYVTESARIQINAPELFGGDEKEGGIVGALDIEMGEPTQTANDYLEAQIGEGRPAYRGILGGVWRGGQVTSNNPYIKPWAVLARRITQGWDGGSAWYPEKAPIVISGSAGSAEVQLSSAAGVSAGVADQLIEYTWQPYISDASYGSWPQNITIRFVGDSMLEGDTLPRRMIAKLDGLTVGDTGWLGHVGDGEALDEILLDEGRNDLAGGLLAVSFSSVDSWPTVQVNLGSPKGDLDVEIYGAGINDGRVGTFNGQVMAIVPAVADTRGYSMNPAHIIYECLTNTAWGMGYDASILDLASFTAAADTFYAEGLGLCLQWSQQETIQGFVQLVLDHAGAVLVEDRVTLQHKLIPIRDDYDIESVPQCSDTLGNVVAVEQLQRAAPTDTVNELTVTYTDVETGKTGSVTLQNLAAIQAAGRVIAETRAYPGLPIVSLALRIAMRDLKAATAGLARVRLIVNRAGYSLYPGAVIALAWSPLGLTQMALRVLDVDYGSLTDGRVTLECIEDVFGLPDTVYVQPTPPPDEPSGQPEAATSFDLLEVPYREILRRIGRSETALVPDDAGYVGALAATPPEYAQSYRLFTRTGSEDYAEAASGDWCPAAALGEALAANETTLTLDSTDRLDQVEAGTLALIGSGRGAELVRIDAVDADSGQIVIGRGCLDTTPKAWATGARVWLGVDDYATAGVTEYVDGETVDALALTVAPQGVLDQAEAPAASITLDSRQWRPYPPGRLRISDDETPDAAYPASCTGELTVTWAHRDRLLQEDQVIDEAEGDIGPEAGTTYTVRWHVEGELVNTEASISGTSATPYSPADGIVRVEVVAVRDGIESWQAAESTFAYGVGLIDGITTEDTTPLLAESGQQLIIEEAA